MLFVLILTMRTVRIHCIGRRVAEDPFEFNHVKYFLPQSKDVCRQCIAATRIDTNTLPHATSNPCINTVAANPVRLEIGSGKEDTSALGDEE